MNTWYTQGVHAGVANVAPDLKETSFLLDLQLKARCDQYNFYGSKNQINQVPIARILRSCQLEKVYKNRIKSIQSLESMHSNDTEEAETVKFE